MKFVRDRKRWLYWLYQVRKRFGLCVLNYNVTSNHIHLLAKDTGADTIPKSVQLIAGRTEQEYNRRKSRQGAYWEDRYHATAVQSDPHQAKFLVYIDLNMIRAGVVKHSSEWQWSGYNEIQGLAPRYRIIDLSELVKLTGTSSLGALQQAHRSWVEEELIADRLQRLDSWSNSIAVGDQPFTEEIQQALGYDARHRCIHPAGARGPEGQRARGVKSSFIRLIGLFGFLSMMKRTNRARLIIILTS